jgi:hypothetical protein
MSPIPKKIPVIAAIVLAAGLVLLLRPAKPKFSVRVWERYHPGSTREHPGSRR